MEREEPDGVKIGDAKRREESDAIAPAVWH